MQNIWAQLIDAWRRQSLPIQNACTENEITTFETKNKITLPPDLREYLRQVNGMRDFWPGDQDQKGFSFWTLKKIKTLAEEIEAQDKKPWSLEGQNSMFLFCDYFTWCWAYAIKIIPDGSRVEGVYLVCCSEPIKVAESFTDFVRMYLEKSEKLQPPVDHKHR